jgi:hypothetical protein
MADDRDELKAELDRLLLEDSQLRDRLADNKQRRREIRERFPRKPKETLKAEALRELRTKYVLIGKKAFVNGLMPVFENKTFKQSAIDLGVHPATIAEAFHKLRRRWVAAAKRQD